MAPRARAPGPQRVSKGGGVPCLIAVGEGAREDTPNRAWPTPKGSAATRGGVLETTIAEETETDLFGEQVVLCGGVSELVKAAFETLVEAGYQPEMAYFECMHELKLIVDLFYQGGLNYMRYSVSNTAEYGDYTRGPRIITDETRRSHEANSDRNSNGRVRREWILENTAGHSGIQGNPTTRARAEIEISRPATAEADELD